jgi:hypothetical protein
MNTSDVELTQAIVKELLDYNPATGLLTWRRRHRHWFGSDHACNVWNARFAGKPAFTANNHGYLEGHILGEKHGAHRIIWLWMIGHWPDPEVDHDNRKRDVQSFREDARSTETQRHPVRGQHHRLRRRLLGQAARKLLRPHHGERTFASSRQFSDSERGHCRSTCRSRATRLFSRARSSQINTPQTSVASAARP